MTFEERREAIKKLTKNQVFWDLKHLTSDKHSELSSAQILRVKVINRYRAEKHLAKYLAVMSGCHFIRANGRYRDPPMYDYSFTYRRILQELPCLNLYLHQNYRMPDKL